MRRWRQALYSLLQRVGLENRPGQRLRLLTRGLRFRHILRYAEIPGWLTESEAVTLYDLARSLPDTHPVVVEIGSWVGRSSLVLAKGIRAKSSPVLYCIDPFDVDELRSDRGFYLTEASKLGTAPKEHFVMNMKTNGVYDLVRLLVGYSTDFATVFAEKIDLLFIDGDHQYEAVLRDYQDWCPLLKAGGVMAFHDVVMHPVGDEHVGPGMVVKLHVLDNPEWADVKLINTLFVARRTGA